jgi:manganese-dependent ADP-ribose/CDP-alcohol diphosphatase
MKRRNFIRLSAVAASFPSAAGAEEMGAGVKLDGVPGDQPLLKFGLITDVQYTDADPDGERHYRESIPKLKTAVEFLANKDLPFTLHLGDLIDRDFKSFDAVLPLLNKLGHPMHHLAGNHDYSIADREKCQVASALGMPHEYYMFRHSGVRFLMIDTNDLSIYKYIKGSKQNLRSEALLKELAAGKAVNGQTWNGGVSEDQLFWIDRELSAADAAQEPVIVCGHHPIYPADAHRAWTSDQVLDMIDKHPSVRAYFCGHNHAGAEVMRNGIPYITFKSILHEPEVNAYSVIHLFHDRVQIEGYGRELPRTIALKTYPV